MFDDVQQSHQDRTIHESTIDGLNDALIYAYVTGPGPWAPFNLLDNNCTVMAQKALKAGGSYIGDTVPTTFPNILMTRIGNVYGIRQTWP